MASQSCHLPILMSDVLGFQGITGENVDMQIVCCCCRFLKVACSSLDVDIISIKLDERTSFRFKATQIGLVRVHVRVNLYNNNICDRHNDLCTVGIRE